MFVCLGINRSFTSVSLFNIYQGTDGIEGAITAHSFNSAYMLIEPMIPIDMSASDPLRCFCDTLVPLLFVLAAYQIQTGALVEAAKLTHWLQRLVEYWPTLSCVTMGVTAADHCYSSWQPREGQHWYTQKTLCNRFYRAK